MTDASLIEFFKLNSEYFISNSIVASAIRYFGWGAIKIITFIASGAENLYNKSFGLIDFTTWPKVNQFVEAFKPLFVAIMAISLFALGIILIFNHEKKPKILINICIAALCVTCSTVVFQQMNTIVKDIKSGIENVKVNDKAFNGVYDIISENLTDLVYLDHKYGMKNLNLSKENGKHATTHSEINKKNLDFIDYNEVLNYSSDDVYEWKEGGEAEDILKKKLVFLPESAEFKVREVFNGFGWNSDGDADMANEFYYRYHFKFFNALCLLIAMIIIYVTMSYKTFRIAWELVFSRLLVVLYSAELSGGQKVSKILVFIRDSYITLLMTVLSIRLFYLGYSFISAYTGSGFIQSIFIVFLAFCVIDGPNLVEKLLGMDIGLGSSLGRLIVAKNMMQSAARVATAPFRYASNRHRQSKMYDNMNNWNNADKENMMNNSENNGKGDNQKDKNSEFNPNEKDENQENKINDDLDKQKGDEGKGFDNKDPNTEFMDKEFEDKDLDDTFMDKDNKEDSFDEKDPNTDFMDKEFENKENGFDNKDPNTNFMDKEFKSKNMDKTQDFNVKDDKMKGDVKDPKSFDFKSNYMDKGSKDHDFNYDPNKNNANKKDNFFDRFKKEEGDK